MKIVCAWCGKDMGEKDGKGVEGASQYLIMLTDDSARGSLLKLIALCSTLFIICRQETVVSRLLL